MKINIPYLKKIKYMFKVSNNHFIDRSKIKKKLGPFII